MLLRDFLKLCRVKRFIINIVHVINGKTIVEQYYIIRNIYKELPLKFLDFKVFLVNIFDENTMVITLKK